MSIHVGRSSRGSLAAYPSDQRYHTGGHGRPSSAIFSSADPRASASSVISNRTGRPRRGSMRAHSPPPVSRQLEILNTRIEPAVSAPSSRQQRRASVSGASYSRGDPRSSSSSIRRSPDEGYYSSGPRHSSASIRKPDDRDRERERERERDEERSRRGTTRFPRKFVNRQAAEESGYPFEEDPKNGTIIVFRALSRSEIDSLVERTKVIRRRREDLEASARGRSSREDFSRREDGKHVAFAPERTTIITQSDRPVSAGALPVPADLEKKAAAEMEARRRAQEVAIDVRQGEHSVRRRVGGTGRSEVVVLR